jgi:hypothetical protein
MYYGTSYKEQLADMFTNGRLPLSNKKSTFGRSIAFASEGMGKVQAIRDSKVTTCRSTIDRDSIFSYFLSFFIICFLILVLFLSSPPSFMHDAFWSLPLYGTLNSLAW